MMRSGTLQEGGAPEYSPRTPCPRGDCNGWQLLPAVTVRRGSVLHERGAPIFSAHYTTDCSAWPLLTRLPHVRTPPAMQEREKNEETVFALKNNHSFRAVPFRSVSIQQNPLHTPGINKYIQDFRTTKEKVTDLFIIHLHFTTTHFFFPLYQKRWSDLK